jgi:hypothetical protein
MKKLLLLLCTTFLFSSCDKDGQIFAGKDQLPAETQTGANTAGCLLNGQVFIPHQEGLSPSLVCNYEFLDGQFYFNLYFGDLRGGGVKDIAVQTHAINLQVGQSYHLNKNIIDDGDFMGGGAQYYISSILSKNFYTKTNKVGELKITRLDLQNSIISGTFWFDAINSIGETVQIRSGRFDMHY